MCILIDKPVPQTCLPGMPSLLRPLYAWACLGSSQTTFLADIDPKDAALCYPAMATPGAASLSLRGGRQF